MTTGTLHSHVISVLNNLGDILAPFYPYLLPMSLVRNLLTPLTFNFSLFSCCETQNESC